MQALNPCTKPWMINRRIGVNRRLGGRLQCSDYFVRATKFWQEFSIKTSRRGHLVVKAIRTGQFFQAIWKSTKSLAGNCGALDDKSLHSFLPYDHISHHCRMTRRHPHWIQRLVPPNFPVLWADPSSWAPSPVSLSLFVWRSACRLSFVPPPFDNSALASQPFFLWAQRCADWSSNSKCFPWPAS